MIKTYYQSTRPSNHQKMNSKSDTSNKLVPHNSLSDVMSVKSTDRISNKKDDCVKCLDLNKNIDHLISYLRSSILHEPCSSCSTCLSFLQFMKQTMKQQEQMKNVEHETLNTPVVTEYYVMQGPQQHYMNRYQQQVMPGFVTKMAPRSPMYTPPSRKINARYVPHAVELPFSGNYSMGTVSSRRVYPTKSTVKRQGGGDTKKSIISKSKTPSINASSTTSAPPPAKKMRKKRAKPPAQGKESVKPKKKITTKAK